jgi:uncharacterized membrane protein
MQDLIPQIFPGLGAMANLHPLLVHFPLALFTAFVVTEVLGLLLRKQDIRTAASGMLYLGTLGAFAAVIAGFGAANTVPHGEEVHEIMERHERLGLSVMLLAGALSAWRIIAHGRFSRPAQILHLLSAFVLLAVMAVGADLGGLMVYKYGVAVQAVQPPAQHHHGGPGHHEEAAQELGPEREPVLPAQQPAAADGDRVEEPGHEPAPPSQDGEANPAKPLPDTSPRRESRGRMPRERTSRPTHEHPPGTPAHRH